MSSGFHRAIEYAAVFGALWVLLRLYFGVANRYGIVDAPNPRSSHTRPTVRGGGLVVLIGIVGWGGWYGWHLPWFVAGTVIIGAISFADDVRGQSAAVRLFVQGVAVAFLMYELSLLSPWWLVVLAGVICVGAVNAFNFMDGINGITGIYSAVNLTTLLVINTWIVEFAPSSLIVFALLGTGVFTAHNLRSEARCFAGDVGSVVLGFTQVFLVLGLVQVSGDYRWMLLFLIYGIDSIATIAYRVANGENVLKAHRSHLYQYLANECRYPHCHVAAFYGLMQLFVNSLLMGAGRAPSSWVAGTLMLGGTGGYLVLRERVLGRLGMVSSARRRLGKPEVPSGAGGQ